MSSNPSTIRLNAALARALEGRKGPGRGLSSTLTRIATRYAATVRQIAPRLLISSSEWRSIALALGDECLADGDVRGIPLQVGEAGHAELRQALSKFGYAELMAVADVCERYWLLDDEASREALLEGL